MKGSLTAMVIVGILLLIFGSIFALQGMGVIQGSFMTGNPFWIYAGSTIAVAGLITAAAGFWYASGTPRAEEMKQPGSG